MSARVASRTCSSTTGVPVVFGVLTTEDLEQALARSGAEGERNSGEEAVHVAVEMVRLRNRFAPRG